MIRYIACAVIAGAALLGCSPSGKVFKQLDLAEKEFHDHIGFVLYDPLVKKTLVDHQGDRYFIPASNTKIFTLFASLQLLGDSVPALRYVQRGDSLIFWGTADPSFLYEDVVTSTRTLEFLGRGQKLFFSPANFDTERYGPGWAWGDYKYSYQVERTPFPVYGNRFRMKKSGMSFVSSPKIFRSDVARAARPRIGSELVRDIGSNSLLYVPGLRDSSFQWEIPFHYSDDYLVSLLSDTLKKEVKVLPISLQPGASTLYSVLADSLYKVMMQESDNFIAEQLLLMCAGVISDTLRTDIAIREVKKRFLTDLPDEAIWVDGSGLSRMNLFTPRTIVAMWEKTSQVVPQDRLFSLVATGGVSGTIKDYYKAERP